MYDYFHDVREPLPSPRRCWIRQVPLRKTNVYHYFHDARERLPPRRPVNVYEMYHYRRPVNVYFPLRTRSARNARFEGITPRRRPWTECMCCMRCTLCLHRARLLHARSSSFAMPMNRGNPVTGITPPSLACSAHPHASFCTGISMSYRDRNVAVAPFLFRRRGTLFVPPW